MSRRLSCRGGVLWGTAGVLSSPREGPPLRVICDGLLQCPLELP